MLHLHVCDYLPSLLTHEVRGQDYPPGTSFFPFTMSPVLRLRRQSNADEPTPQIKNLARSPPPSPQAEKIRPREPHPIPSSNPASQYTLLEKLGTGSFGVVYKAIHNDTKQIVAVKQIGKPSEALCLAGTSHSPCRPRRFGRRHI